MVSLGHAHPVVAEAVATQARTLSHVSNLYGNTLGPEVALTIDRLINGGTGQAGGQVFFANSGAEANECALKLARRWAGGGTHGTTKHVVISADNSFHGRTLATLTATGQPEKHAPFLPLPEGFVHVPYDDVPALDAALDADTVAGVLLEPLQGEGGVMVPSSDYLGAVRALCTERNALLMLDEVQTGLGRTGHWFAFQAQGLEPDVVTMAKALGNGMPVGACWARAEVAAAFGPGRPRLDVRRPAAGHGGGAGHPGRDGGRGRVRAGPACRGAPGGRAGRAARRGVGPRRRAAAGRPARRRPRPRRSRRRARRRAAGQPGASRCHPGGAAPAGERRTRSMPPWRSWPRSWRRRRPPPPPRRRLTPCPTSSTWTTCGPTATSGCSSWPRATTSGRCSPGQGVALLFEKPSARTRNSTEMAVVGLGGHPVYIQGTEVGLDTRESAEDIARTLGCYHRILCARVFDHDVLPRMAFALEGSGFDVPVVNLLSDEAHPCQAIADVLTLRETLGPLPGQVLAYIGDANNMCRSLVKVALMEGMDVRVASPPGYSFSAEELDRPDGPRRAGRARRDAPRHRRSRGRRRRGRRALHRRLDEHGAGGGDGRARLAAFAGFIIDDALLDVAEPDVVVLHCLPAHRGEEIAASVLEGSHSVVWRQAAHRQTAMRGILAWAIEES